MGGEKITDETIGTVIQGSPPRGRGKVYTILRIQLIFGITPAWAGKRRQKRNCTHSNRDHPRVGGEKSMISTR